MRIIDRYIAQHLLRTFVLSVATLSFAILIHYISLFLDLLVSKGVGPTIVLRLFLYSLPLALFISIPLSALLATTAVCGRMSVDNETVALRAAGVPLLRLHIPPLAFGAAASLVTLYIALILLPSSARSFRDLVFLIARERVLVGLQEGTFYNDLEGLSLYVGHLGPDGALREVLLEDRREVANPRLVLAREGQAAFDKEALRMVLRLRDGTIHIVPRDTPGRYQVLSFRGYDMRIDLGGRLGDMAGRSKSRKELTLQELLEAARARRAQGQRDNAQWVEIHRRFATPLSCLFLALIGSVLGFRIRAARLATNLAIGLAIGLGYFALLAGGEDLGTRGNFDPALAMWLPDAILAAAAASLFLLGAREEHPGLRLGFPSQRPQPAAPPRGR
jgi:lipopolysaccharide export system permease protein